MGKGNICKNIFSAAFDCNKQGLKNKFMYIAKARGQRL